MRRALSYLTCSEDRLVQTETNWVSRKQGILKERRKRQCGYVWERVRQCRKAQGMTPEQREAASGVSQGSSASIDSGPAEEVYASTVIGFAKALHVSADSLFGLKAQENWDQEAETPTTQTAG